MHQNTVVAVTYTEKQTEPKTPTIIESHKNQTQKTQQQQKNQIEQHKQQKHSNLTTINFH